MGQIYLGSGQGCANDITITGILVTPSAGSWVCILQDTAGNTLFSAKGVTDASVFFPVSISASAFNQSTATNITAVMLYT